MEIERINLCISSGTLRNHLGHAISQPIESALIRQDGAVAYPIRDDMPWLLVEESIAICDLFPYASSYPFMSHSR